MHDASACCTALYCTSADQQEEQVTQQPRPVLYNNEKRKLMETFKLKSINAHRAPCCNLDIRCCSFDYKKCIDFYSSTKGPICKALLWVLLSSRRGSKLYQIWLSSDSRRYYCWCFAGFGLVRLCHQTSASLPASMMQHHLRKERMFFLM